MTRAIEAAAPPSQAEIDAALARAATRVHDWAERQIRLHAQDLVRLYRTSRDQFVARLRNIYDTSLRDDPTFLRARLGPGGAELDALIGSTVQDLANRIADEATRSMADFLSTQPAQVSKHLPRAWGRPPLAPLPVSAQSVFNELTTQVIAGGTFYDRLFHVTDGLRSDLVSQIRTGLLNGDDFDTVRDRVQKVFGVDRLPAPKQAAYGAVKVYKNAARRAWNDLMGGIAATTGGVEIWWATIDERTTPGCLARHGQRISELGESPPRHVNCRCGVAVMDAGADLAQFQAAADQALSARGQSRRSAAQMEAATPPLASDLRFLAHGAFHVFPGPRHRAVVLTAPHGEADTSTGQIVDRLARGLGCSRVTAHGFTPGETGSPRLNINRPTEGIYPDEGQAQTEPRTARAAEVYRRYLGAVRAAAGGWPPRVYLEIHDNDTPATQGALEVATVGVVPEQARAIRAAWPPDAPVGIKVEGVDEDLHWRAAGAKQTGVFGQVPLGLQVEVPLAYSDAAAAGGPPLRRLGQWLAAVLTILAPPRQQEAALKTPHGAVLNQQEAADRAGILGGGGDAAPWGMAVTPDAPVGGRDTFGMRGPHWSYWLWGHDQVTPLYQVPPGAAGERRPLAPYGYATAPWHRLPRIASGERLRAAHRDIPTAQRLGGPDHALLRGVRDGRATEVYTRRGWRALPGSVPGEVWTETLAGRVLDSPAVGAPYERRARRLPPDVLSRFPALARVTYTPACYAAQTMSRAEATHLTLGDPPDGPPTWVAGEDLGTVVRGLLIAPVPGDRFLAVARVPRASAYPTSMGGLNAPVRAADLVSVVSLSTGQALYAREEFDPALAAPYERVAVACFEPDGRLWAVRPRGVAVWTLPGGHVDSGETLLQAARREMAEETGVTCAPVRKLGTLYRPWSTTHVFLARRDGPVGPPVTPEEFDAVGTPIAPADLALEEQLFLARAAEQNL